MTIASESPQKDRQAVEAFNELRSIVGEQMLLKGLSSGFLDRRRGEAEAITTAHIDKLKSDLILLFATENKRNVKWGILTNSVFFILGIVAGILIDIAKSKGYWPV